MGFQHSGPQTHAAQLVHKIAHLGAVHIAHAGNGHVQALGLAAFCQGLAQAAVFGQGLAVLGPAQNGGLCPEGQQGTLACTVAGKILFPVLQHPLQIELQMAGCHMQGRHGPGNVLVRPFRIAAEDHLQGMGLAGQGRAQGAAEHLAHFLVFLAAREPEAAGELDEGDHGGRVGHQDVVLLAGVQAAQGGGRHVAEVLQIAAKAVQCGKESVQGHGRPPGKQDRNRGNSGPGTNWKLCACQGTTTRRVVTRLVRATPWG